MSEKIASFAAELGDRKELLPTPQIKVVEIGYGDSPACYEGGTLFDNPHVSYDGIDLPVEKNDIWGKYFPDDERNRFLVGDFSRLPYNDESVDYVILRSVFGQRKHTHNNLYGILEAARVLRVGGQLVISEENTPFDAENIWSGMISAGLGIRDFYLTNRSAPDRNWQPVRNMFYRRPIDMLHDNAPGGWYGRPYIIIAEKRPDVERSEFQIPLHPAYTDGTEPGHDEIEYRGKIANLIVGRDAVVRTFQRPAFPERDIPEIANIRRKQDVA